MQSSVHLPRSCRRQRSITALGISSISNRPKSLLQYRRRREAPSGAFETTALDRLSLSRAGGRVAHGSVTSKAGQAARGPRQRATWSRAEPVKSRAVTQEAPA